MKKRNCILLTLFLSLIIISSVYAADPVTLLNQPPADASDCTSSVETATDVGWIRNGYVSLSFNDTDRLVYVEFYRGATKILTFDLSDSFLLVCEEEQPAPDVIPVIFYKLQWYNHTDGGWDTWDVDNEIPDEYFAYRQQIIVRVMFQDDPETPFYSMAGVFTITRGMPWVQVDWEITNLFGGPRYITFVPEGYFWVPSDRTILSSSLTVWNETTGMNFGNAFASDSWFTVGFTVTDITDGAVIQLFNGTYEDLAPLRTNAIVGHSTGANWTTNYTDPEIYSYNYTFMLGNLNSIPKWHFAELYTPTNLQMLKLYYSIDNGTTWTHGIDYNWTAVSGDATGFKTTNGTSINATIYEKGYYEFNAATEDAVPVISTENADPPAEYDYFTCAGVIDRVAFALEFPADTEQPAHNSSSYCLVKVQAFFTRDIAIYSFARHIALGRGEFTDEPEQDYDLYYQTDGRLQFVKASSASSPMWAIGLNASLSYLVVVSHANGSLALVAFGSEVVLDNDETGCTTTNLIAFLSVSTTAYSAGNTQIPDIFEFGRDNPRYQYHEALVKTTFGTLQTYLPAPPQRRRYILNWTQTLTPTEWDSAGVHTIALVEYNRAANGWMPAQQPLWLYRRSSSPVVDTFYSLGLPSVEFYLTTIVGGVPQAGATPTPPAQPPLSILQLSETETIAILTATVIIAIAATVYLLMRKH